MHDDVEPLVCGRVAAVRQIVVLSLGSEEQATRFDQRILRAALTRAPHVQRKLGFSTYLDQSSPVEHAGS